MPPVPTKKLFGFAQNPWVALAEAGGSGPPDPPASYAPDLWLFLLRLEICHEIEVKCLLSGHTLTTLIVILAVIGVVTDKP